MNIRRPIRLSTLLAFSALAACAPPEAGVQEDELLALSASRAPSGSSGSASSPAGTAVVGLPTDRAVMDPGRTARPPGTEAGCDGRRVIGQRSDPASLSCPAPTSTNWRGRLLFDPSVTTNPDRRGPVLAQGGGAFCLYEWTQRSTPQLAGLPEEAIYERRRRAGDDVGVPVRRPEQWLQADCAAVVPMGETSDAQLDTFASAYRDTWRTRMDRLPSLPRVARVVGSTGLTALDLPATTEVALLDSSPDSGLYWPEPTQGEDLHGRAMGLLIDDLMCPQGRTGGACAHFTHTYEVIGDTERPSAQSAAYIGRLAERIVEATRQRWGSRLIINLSVAYSPHYGFVPTSDDVRNYRLATHALLTALNYASLNGALVIVAAGNDEGADDTLQPALRTGALFPGAFVGHNGWNYDAVRSPRGVPLVYAASALDNGDADGPTTRGGATARFAAPGTMAAAINRADAVVTAPEPIGVLSGSSVSAAALSGVAGLVWAYAPDLSADAVMSSVYAAAVPLGRTASLCEADGTSCSTREMRRIDACMAVSNALLRAYRTTGRRDYLSARSTLRCARQAAGSVTRPVLPATFFSSLDVAPSLMSAERALLPVSDRCLPSDGVRVPFTEAYTGPETPLSYCPLRELGNGIGAVALGPQPPTDPCTLCVLKLEPTGRLVLYAQLDPIDAADLPYTSLLGRKGALLLGDSMAEPKDGFLGAIEIPAGAFYLAEGEDFVTLSFPDDVKGLARVAVVPVYR